MELLRGVHILLNVMRTPSSHLLTVVVSYSHEEYINRVLNKPHVSILLGLKRELSCQLG